MGLGLVKGAKLLPLPLCCIISLIHCTVRVGEFMAYLSDDVLPLSKAASPPLL